MNKDVQPRQGDIWDPFWEYVLGDDDEIDDEPPRRTRSISVPTPTLSTSKLTEVHKPIPSLSRRKRMSKKSDSSSTKPMIEKDGEAAKSRPYRLKRLDSWTKPKITITTSAPKKPKEMKDKQRRFWNRKGDQRVPNGAPPEVQSIASFESFIAKIRVAPTTTDPEVASKTESKGKSRLFIPKNRFRQFSMSKPKKDEKIDTVVEEKITTVQNTKSTNTSADNTRSKSQQSVASSQNDSKYGILEGLAFSLDSWIGDDHSTESDSYVSNEEATRVSSSASAASTVPDDDPSVQESVPLEPHEEKSANSSVGSSTPYMPVALLSTKLTPIDTPSTTSQTTEVRLKFQPIEEESEQLDDYQINAPSVADKGDIGAASAVDAPLSRTFTQSSNIFLPDDAMKTQKISLDDPAYVSELTLDFPDGASTTGSSSIFQGISRGTSDVNSNRSVLRVSSSDNGLRRSLSNRLRCRSYKDGHMRDSSDELSHIKLAEMFPKVRLVADEKGAVRTSETLDNSTSFETNFTSYVQKSSAIVAKRQGPQSLLEYEYEKGVHMNVVYNQIGPSAKEILSVVKSAELPHDPKGKMVLVQVEASTVSFTDCKIRQGKCNAPANVDDLLTPGVDFVGRVSFVEKAISREFQLTRGDRVLSLTKYGGNSRYILADANSLIKVPEKLDPAEVAPLIETYLTAFQALYLDQNSSTRYKQAALSNTTVLVIGKMTSNLGRALAQIAASGQINTLYGTTKPKHFEYLIASGVKPLDWDSSQWPASLEQTVDTLIYFEGESINDHHKRYLKRTGRIVSIDTGNTIQDDKDKRRNKKSIVSSMFKKVNVQRDEVVYDVYQEWKREKDKCKKDLDYLLYLLKEGIISPHILDRVPLNKVARAQEIIETKQLSGFLVCEPWLVNKSRAVLL